MCRKDVFVYACGCRGGTGAVFPQRGCNPGRPSQKCEKSVASQERNPTKRSGPCPTGQHAVSTSPSPVPQSAVTGLSPPQHLTAPAAVATSHEAASGSGSLLPFAGPSNSQDGDAATQASIEQSNDAPTEDEWVAVGGDSDGEHSASNQDDSSMSEIPSDENCGNDQKRCNMQ